MDLRFYHWCFCVQLLHLVGVLLWRVGRRREGKEGREGRKGRGTGGERREIGQLRHRHNFLNIICMVNQSSDTHSFSPLFSSNAPNTCFPSLSPSLQPSHTHAHTHMHTAPSYRSHAAPVATNYRSHTAPSYQSHTVPSAPSYQSYKPTRGQYQPYEPPRDPPPPYNPACAPPPYGTT